jgi:putative membrane-bound dehydrogenase-like protein
MFPGLKLIKMSYRTPGVDLFGGDVGVCGMKIPFAVCLSVSIVTAGMDHARGADAAPKLAPVLKVPPEFTIELVAGAPLVERPIVAAFDDEGRLYVAESSGSNDPVEEQLRLRPHRVVRLKDSDGDGKYDQRTVFADRMMFPEGAMHLDGSLYVSAPPSIWKLTDHNDDGVADERIEWFQGKTLTGCANDLHGPYLGLDGWVYWCKGAFAEQTHIVNGREWKSRASHIFRCRPDGSGFEPVLTGGMDNPVDVVFTPTGERILSATFLQDDGRRDGLVHAIYGGVYGKEHGVLDGHPRTGDLMPALVLMSPAAPCGLERYDSPVFGADYLDNLFTCQFNLRKVSRHVLRSDGSTYASDDHDFVYSDDVDFHPTDVLMDADGSLLVIDTGGWYKLCCPTSQLWKPDVLGGIYRVRRVNAPAPVDPRGRTIGWSQLSTKAMWDLLSDVRSAVRQRATRQLVRRATQPELLAFLDKLKVDVCAAISAEPPMADSAGSCDRRTASLARAWALVQLEIPSSHALVRQLLSHEDDEVRRVALQSVSLHRDGAATPDLLQILAGDTAANRRVAAEALGRIGDRTVVPQLLSAAAVAEDRLLRHSIIYALIELADPATTRTGLASSASGTLATALVALDQMPDGDLEADQVVPLLSSGDELLRLTARWLVTQHPEWGADLAEWFEGQLAESNDQSQFEPGHSAENPLESMLTTFATEPAIQDLLAAVVVDKNRSLAARRVALRVMAEAKLGKPPLGWYSALAAVISADDPHLLELAVEAARGFPATKPPHEALNRALARVGDRAQVARAVRLAALAAATASLPELNDPQFQLLVDGLSADSAAERSSSADALSGARLSRGQLKRLCSAIESAGPLELNRLLPPFQGRSDDQLGLQLLASLKAAVSLPALRIDVLREVLESASSDVQQGIAEMQRLVNVDADAQRNRIEELLPLMMQGDERRGHAVFYSSKAACSECHRMGYAGGTIGPELTRIGETRTERDLLESILYPSLSFVRSYEPMVIVTTDGRTINATVRNETDHELLLAIGPNEEMRLARQEVDQMEPGTVSIMPAGLEKQLTPQELADLVTFLKHATGR